MNGARDCSYFFILHVRGVNHPSFSKRVRIHSGGMEALLAHSSLELRVMVKNEQNGGDW